jgi:uncharacterized protein (DUF1684 family)
VARNEIMVADVRIPDGADHARGRTGAAELTPVDALTLVDWRRSVFELYGEIRASTEPDAAWHVWRRERERLMRTHPQSPVSESRRGEFRGCRYFDYDPAARVLAHVSPAKADHREIVTSTGVSYSFTRFGEATFELYGTRCSLQLYWLDGYGGGIFVPFGDGTSGESTYPAGRYLLDTVKGADLGSSGDRLVFDFNFAYNPSCAYDPRWVCPLAPTENWLPVHVRAGEQTP